MFFFVWSVSITLLWIFNHETDNLEEPSVSQSWSQSIGHVCYLVETKAVRVNGRIQHSNYIIVRDSKRKPQNNMIYGLSTTIAPLPFPRSPSCSSHIDLRANLSHSVVSLAATTARCWLMKAAA